MDNDPSTVHFVGSIVDLRTANYARAFSGIGYIEITLITGERIVIYSSAYHSADIKSVATRIKDAGDGYYDGLDTEYKALIDLFAGYEAPTVEIAEDIVPALSTDGTLMATTVTEENGSYYVYKNVTANEITTYKAMLINAGLKLYSSNTLDSAEFATYTGNTKSVRLFFYPAESEFRILVTDLAYLPENEKPVCEAIEGLVPTDTMIKSNGVNKIGALSHVLQFVDGSFAVVDGGCEDAEDAYNLLEYLWENKPENNAKPRVTWFFTHAHNDHVDLPNSFLEAYPEFIELEMAVYNYPDYDTFTVTTEGSAHSLVRQERLERILATYYPNATKYICHTGDKLYLPGCTVDVLMTYLDFYPDTFAGINETCSVFKFTFDGGNELLITGDIYPYNCNFLINNYPTVLKCAVVQTPHHGRDGADAAFYNAILDELKILMWSNSEAFFEVREGSANDAYDWSFNSIVLDAVGVSHYNASQTVIVNMNDLTVYVNGSYDGSYGLEELRDLNVLAVGDSLFGGHNLGCDNQWLAILAKEYGWNLTNLGSNGWLIANNPSSERPSMSVQVRNDPAFAFGSASYYNYGDTASKTAEDVDVIFVEGGYNDYMWGTPLGTLDSTDDTTFYGALNLMIPALLGQYPNATVILHTSWHLSGTKTIAGETVDRMDYLANAMKNIYNYTYANNDRVVLIDAGDPELSGVYMADAEWRAEYSCTPDDTAHLNQKGMELMADSMDNLMAKALYGAKQTRVLCVGDSITAGGYWENNLQGYLNERYDVYGLGVSGTTGLWNGVDLGFDPTGASYSYVSKPEYELSKRYGADVVVIMLGTNDTKPENYANISSDNGAQFIADMTAMVESYQNLANSPKVFLALPATIYRDPASGSMSNVNLEELIIPSLEAVAAATGAILIDVHGATANAAEHFADGVHPGDDTGRALIAQAVADAIIDAANS